MFGPYLRSRFPFEVEAAEIDKAQADLRQFVDPATNLPDFLREHPLFVPAAGRVVVAACRPYLTPHEPDLPLYKFDDGTTGPEMRMSRVVNRELVVVRPIVPARQARIDVYRGGTPRDLFRIFGLVPIDPEAADPISNIIYHNGQDYALTQPPTGEFVEQLRVLCAPVVQAFDIGVEFTP